MTAFLHEQNRIPGIVLVWLLVAMPFSAQAVDSPFDFGGHTAVQAIIPEVPEEQGISYGMSGRSPEFEGTETPAEPQTNKAITPVSDTDCPSTAESPKTSGSPFQVATGNFFHTNRDFSLPAPGPDLAIIRTYNSRDTRNGPFGHGWTFAYDQRVIETTNGVEFFAICRQGTGKRDRFLKNPDGSFTPPAYSFSNLTKHGDGTFSLNEKNGFQRRFNTEGRLTAVIDRNGNALQLTYDSTGFLTGVTDAANRTVKLTKGANGKIDSITDFTNRTFRYFYDGEGNLIEFVDPLGNRTQYQYDARHHLVKMIDPRGNSAQGMTFDAAGRILTLKDAEGSWKVQYFPDQNKTTKTRSDDFSVWTFVYNANGNILEKTDHLGNKTLFAYDQHFKMTGFTDPNGNTTTLAYDRFGNLTSTTDALGHVATFTYEPVFQQIATITDRLGQITKFEYDSKGNLITMTDALGQIAQLAYNSQGLPVTGTDPLGQVTSFTYDAVGNLIQATDPLGHATSLAYDSRGNITTVTDAEGHSTRLTYDVNDRVTESTDALGTLTKYSYDKAGNLATVTDGNGHVTTFEYDAFNRTTKIINPLGQTQVLTYDTQGNLKGTQDADNRLNFYGYDRLNRLTNKSIVGGFNTIVKYDKAGNVVDIASNAPSKLSFAYDKLNRLMEVQTGATTIQSATTIAYTYDDNGNRLTMTDPLDGVTKYTYDALNRLKALTNPKGETFAFAFDSLSRRTSTAYPNNAATAYQYDAASRLTSLVTQAGGITLNRFDYVHDKIGNRTMLTDLAGVHTYAYDAVSQLTAATHPQATSPTETFTLDPAGNRTASHLSPTYTHDAANRLEEDHAFKYSYGKNGNLLHKTEKASGKITTRYIYDGDNQLTGIQFSSPPLPAVSYSYDGLGRRIQKNAGGKLTRYVYDGEDILMEYDGTNSVQARYTHGPGIDEPLAMDRNGQSFMYHADGLGSITTLSNSAGSAVQSYRYDSFGNIVNQTGSLTNPYTYTGREYDEETGLYYYRARYYDPKIGRFITEDPIGFIGGLNFYQYVSNNSINKIDSFGLQPGLKDVKDKFKQLLTVLKRLELPVVRMGQKLLQLGTVKKLLEKIPEKAQKGSSLYENLLSRIENGVLDTGPLELENYRQTVSGAVDAAIQLCKASFASTYRKVATILGVLETAQ